MELWNKIKPYALSIAAALAVGGLSALLTRENMDIYNEINKPPLSPPMPVFPIVWGILFVLMGIGAALVYQKREGEDARGALTVYALQLAVNFFWSIIFFNMRAYVFAFIWLLLLLALITAMIIKFKAISSAAAYLQFPYAAWTAFAGYLTLAIALMN